MSLSEDDQNQWIVVKPRAKKYSVSQESDNYSESSDQDFILSKERSKQLFKTKKSKGQITYSKLGAVYYLTKRFQKQEKYGYKFAYHYCKFPQQNASLKPKIMRRKVYVKYRCTHCQDKKWTSLLGNFQLKFQLLKKYQYQHRKSQQMPKFKDVLRDGWIFLWSLKFYDQMCLQCKNWINPSIYASQLKACQIQLWILIYEITNKIKRQKNDDNQRHKLNQQNHFHREDQCQACFKGVCYNISKQQAAIRRQKKLQEGSKQIQSHQKEGY